MAPAPSVAEAFRRTHDTAGTFSREVDAKVAGPAGHPNLRTRSREIVDAALRNYGGPCPHAYADVLSAYIAAPDGGRDALFLEVAYRAVGVRPPSQTPCPGSPATSAPAQPPANDPAVVELLKNLLALAQALQVQSAEEQRDAPR